jgi:phenylalanine-4-hydroxylase
MSQDLNAYDILESKTVKLEFEGGIIVEGEIVTGSRNLQEIILIRLKTVLLHMEKQYYSNLNGCL